MVYKKLIAFAVSFLISVCLTVLPSLVQSEENCNIILQYKVGSKQYYVNFITNTMDSEPEIVDSRTFLVIRFVTMHIPGTTLDWEGSERKVTIKTPSGKTVKLWIGKSKAEVNGKIVDIDPKNPDKIAPYLKDGRTKLPMRFVGEQLDAKILWDPANQSVTLTIRDTVNCDCSWEEGCIVQWTEAPNNLYQVSFVQNCDKKNTLERYLIEKNLKSTTEGLDLSEYLKKYPKPPYPTTKICLNQNRKIIKWDPVRSPDTNPPPPDPPKPPEPPPGICCTYKLNQLTQSIMTLKPGQTYFYIYQLKNICPPGAKSINFQFAPISNITTITPKQLMLSPGQEITIKVEFTMPKECSNNTKVTFSFKMGADCSDKEEISFFIQCDSPPAPPDPPPPPEPKGPGRIIVSLGSKCVGVITTFASLSDPGAAILTKEANIKGNCDTDCTMVFGDTYRVYPHSDLFKFTPEFVDVKITQSCPDGIIRVSFDATEVPPSCCKWQFRLISGIDSENWALAPGETKVIEAYEVINTCSLNANKLLFTIDWPNDGKIISITPKIFTLKPSEHQTLKITIKMPEEAVDDQVVTFPYSISPHGCEKKDIQLTAHVARFLCKSSTVKLKITEINQSEGWVYGIKIVESLNHEESSMALPVKIYYTVGDNYWKLIQVNHCYKICYSERNDSSGKSIKWGHDYRKLPCPE